MRKMMLVGLVGASLGLASCGAQASIDQAVSSFGSSPDLQLHFTASETGPDAAKAQKMLSLVSVDMNYSNPSGMPLSQSGGTANAEILVNAGTKTLADVRVVDSNIYVLFDVSAAASIPGVNVPSTQLAPIQLLFGGRWFELPKSLWSSLTPTTSATSQVQAAKETAAAASMVDEISTLIAATPYTTLANGTYSETGTLDSALKAIFPTIQSLTSATIPTTSVKGTYTLTVTAPGSNATGGSISVTAPSSVPGQGNDTVGVDVTVAHAGLNIDTPASATVITPTILQGLVSQVGG